jgi:hypothetical protein
MPGHYPRRIITLITLFLLAAIALPLLSHDKAGAANTTPLNIVSLGDSYASGEGDPGPDGWINNYGNTPCDRSDQAAPVQALAMLQTLRSANALTTWACTGSVIEDVADSTDEKIDGAHDSAHRLLGPGGQLTLLSPSPANPIDLLTISIGGNDLHFADIVTACIGELDCTSPSSGGEQMFQSGAALLPGKLTALVNAVNALPDVRNVMLTEYPDPTTGLDGRRCGSFLAPGFDGFDGISEAEATWASDTVLATLNNDLAQAVLAGNSLVTAQPHAVWHLDTSTASAFNDHGYCTGPGTDSLDPSTAGNPRYVNTLYDSFAVEGTQTGAMHGNEAGQEALAVGYENGWSFLFGPQKLQVSASPAPVLNQPTTLTITDRTFDQEPIVGASILIDGVAAGTTNQFGVLVVSHTFSTAGYHPVTAQADPYADGTVNVAVPGVAYQVTASPSPVPVDKVIPQLTLTAAQSISGGQVSGTFTLTGANGTTTLRSGTAASNVRVNPWTETVTIIGGTGKPISSTETLCPTLTFQPDQAIYVGGTFSTLLACKGLAGPP